MVIGFAVLLTQNQLVHELADQGEDILAGDKTTGQWLGKTSTLLFCSLAGMGGAGAALFLPSPMNIVGCLGLVAATVVIVACSQAPPRARRIHRWVSVVSGAAYYVATLV